MTPKGGKGSEKMNKNEKVYRVASQTAIWNLVMGIVILVTGITWGVLLLISGERLQKSKNDLTF